MKFPKGEIIPLPLKTLKDLTWGGHWLLEEDGITASSPNISAIESRLKEEAEKWYAEIYMGDNPLVDLKEDTACAQDNAMLRFIKHFFNLPEMSLQEIEKRFAKTNTEAVESTSTS